MAVCVCWKRKRRFLRGWKVFSVTWKIPCGDTNTIYMIYYNKVHVLGSISPEIEYLSIFSFCEFDEDVCTWKAYMYSNLCCVEKVALEV